MVPGFASGHLMVIVPGFTRRLYRINDPLVARAAAKVSIERLGNRLPARCLAVLQQGTGSHDDSGYAKATLNPALQHESLAQNPAHLFRNALQGRDLVPFQLVRLTQAGERRSPVDQNQAAAAGSFRSAPILGGNNATLFSQKLQDVHPTLVRDRDRLSVQDEVGSRQGSFSGEHLSYTRNILSLCKLSY